MGYIRGSASMQSISSIQQQALHTRAALPAHRGLAVARPMRLTPKPNAAALTLGPSLGSQESSIRKVAIFVEPSPFSHISGMKNRFESLIKGLREAGDDVMVVTPDPTPPKEFFGAKVRVVLLLGTVCSAGRFNHHDAMKAVAIFAHTQWAVLYGPQGIWNPQPSTTNTMCIALRCNFPLTLCLPSLSPSYFLTTLHSHGHSQVVNVLGFKLPFYKSTTLLLSAGLSVRVLWYLWKQRPDVIHVSTPGILCFAAVLYARLLAVPLVMSYHTHIPEYIPR